MINNEELLKKFNKVTIIGNGPGDIILPNQGTVITFNETRISSKDVGGRDIINISNGEVACSNEPFTVSGKFIDTQDLEVFTKALVETANLLKQQLSCWPSTGLVTLFTLEKISKDIGVKRMTLLPSLKRRPQMRSSEYLPCMVHNWLGERRLAMTLKDKVSWPEFVIPENNFFTLEAEKWNFGCPFTMLIKFNEVYLDKSMKAIGVMRWLAFCPVLHWLKHVTQSKLLSCEKLFFNEEPDKDSFWYLIDNEASTYLDPIRAHLAYCQYVKSENQ
ncbi:hypothetical protein [Shewanella waksmanii]|uniref:hypothetical protein n=1 Tax=Shewanella waksmanii TaxID=213783 RepID=UPI00373593FF